jgi:hypothetical protein
VVTETWWSQFSEWRAGCQEKQAGDDPAEVMRVVWLDGSFQR